MPSTPRKRTSATKAAPAKSTTAKATPAVERPPADAAAEQATGTGSGHRGNPLVSLVTFPLVATRAVAEDVVAAARRPDAVAYWGGLAGLAVLGVLDWPAAAALGVGVAVANGVRRSRA